MQYYFKNSRFFLVACVLISVLFALSCRSPDPGIVHSKEEEELLLNIDVPEDVDVLAIAKGSAAREMGVSSEDVRVVDIWPWSFRGSSGWQVFVALENFDFDVAGSVYIAKNGQAVKYSGGR